MGSAQSSQPLSIRESTLSDANIQRDFCIARESIKPEQLPPPVLRHPHKKLVFSIATNEGKNVNRQPIGYTRWRVIPFPPKFGTQACPHFQCEQNVYQYPDAEQTSNTEIHWFVAFEAKMSLEGVVFSPFSIPFYRHVNFADPSLFVAYGGGLFAQDEMQAAEMPALGPVREFLLEKADAARSRPNGNGGEPAIAPHTRASQRPTPILVMNADRRVKIETNRNAAAGRPMGLYGNMFGRAPESAIISATKSLDPPSLVHLVCIAALGGGNGAYTSQQIIDTLANAYTGFLSARIESQAASAPKDNDAGPARPPKRVVIHTGNWCVSFYICCHGVYSDIVVGITGVPERSEETRSSWRSSK
jgi:hypothetical protein